MKKYQNRSPEEVIKMVTIEIIERAIKLGKKKNRSVYISKTSGGKGVEVTTLNPKQRKGVPTWNSFSKPSGAITLFTDSASRKKKMPSIVRVLNAPTWRTHTPVPSTVFAPSTMRGIPSKIKFFRKMGVHIGENTEIMQGVWLDHFRPELIFIGDNTLMGAFLMTVHADEPWSISLWFSRDRKQLYNRCRNGNGRHPHRG